MPTSVAGAGGPAVPAMPTQLPTQVPIQLPGTSTGTAGSCGAMGGAAMQVPPTIAGAAGAPATPTQAAPTQATPAQAGHAHGAGGGGAHAGGAHGGHGAHLVERDTPERRAKAQRYLDATSTFFANVKRSDVEFNKADGTGTHAVLPERLRKAFEQQYPGLEAPRSVVFAKDGGTQPLGVVYNEREGDFDLGMGQMHQHSAGGNAMQHIWFTTNLELAFSPDAKPKDIVAAKA